MNRHPDGPGYPRRTSNPPKDRLQGVVQLILILLFIGGAFFGHLILGYDLSFISSFGLVALTGVVINDSVVLIDYYNRRHRRSGGSEYGEKMPATTPWTRLRKLYSFGLLFAGMVMLFLLPSMIRMVDDIRRRVGSNSN